MVPFFLEFLPTFQIITSVLLQMEIVSLSAYETALYIWIPIIDPIITIYIVKCVYIVIYCIVFRHEVLNGVKHILFGVRESQSTSIEVTPCQPII